MHSSARRRAVEHATAAAEQWLRLTDAAQYQRAWQEAAASLRNTVSAEQFAQSLAATLGPLGAVTARSRRSGRFHTQLPGAPDGEYVVLRFRTAFAHKRRALETVTPMREPDGQWRVSGYYIR